jgi:hypothetical protein
LRRSLGFCLVTLGVFVAPGCAQAPQGMPPIYRHVPKVQTATIAGTLRDSATGRPITGALVAASWPARQGRVPTDSTGAFLLDWVEPGPVLLQVNCPSRTLLGPLLATFPVRVDTGRTLTMELHADRARCIEPDSGAYAGRFRGVYSAGFEESRFWPCATTKADMVMQWEPSGYRYAWVQFTAPVDSLPSPPWPRGHMRDGYPKWYVEWHGTLIGPGRFGHMGVSPYLLRIDSVIIVRRTPPANCNPVDG